MGGPTSAIVSEICMQSLETTAITTADHPPRVWERHVNDVFSTVHKICLQELLKHINNLHLQTQFTKEEGNNSTLSFLDTLVQRNNDKTISVKIYRKPTHTNQYLKYTLHNPTSAKRSVITALFDRADNVVSNEKDKIEEKSHILAALQQIKTAIQNNSSKEQSKSTTGEKNSQERAQKKSLSKPRASTYLTSKESVSSLNDPLISKHNIKATLYTQTTLRSLLSKPKDPIPKEDRSNAVYQLNCKDCEAVYVEETKQTGNIRAEEHITVIKSASKRSHTAEHCWNYNQDFDWEHKKVLDFEKNWKTKPIKEVIFLEENEHHINGISFQLPNIWKPILPESKAKKTTAKTTTSSY